MSPGPVEHKRHLQRPARWHGLTGLPAKRVQTGDYVARRRSATGELCRTGLGRLNRNTAPAAQQMVDRWLRITANRTG